MPKILKDEAKIKVKAEITNVYNHNKGNHNNNNWVTYINSHDNVYNQCTYCSFFLHFK